MVQWVHIYAAGQRIAREIWGSVSFEHHNPATGSWVTSHGHSSYRTTTREERDPRGAEMPLSNPYAVAENYVDWKFGQPLFIEGSDPFDYVPGVTKDGLPMARGDLGRIFGKLGPAGFLLFDVYRIPKTIFIAGEHERYLSEFYVGSITARLDQASQRKRGRSAAVKTPPKRSQESEHDRLPGSEMTACLVMADIAEREADTANYRGTSPQNALRLFDNEFSRLYHGGPIRGLEDADKWKDGTGRAEAMKYYASNGSGFKMQFRDTGPEEFPLGGYGAEQTHHFSFYVSLGINTSHKNLNIAIYIFGYLGDNEGGPTFKRGSFQLWFAIEK